MSLQLGPSLQHDRFDEFANHGSFRGEYVILLKFYFDALLRVEEAQAFY